jgi:hypothetical protein
MTPSTSAAFAALPPRDDRPPARYALELSPGQAPDDVAAEVRRDLAALDPDVFPISPTDHGVLVLELRARTLRGTEPATAYAAGYALADDLGLRTAEPDIPTPFFPEEDPPAEGDLVAEKIRFPPGCWVDDERGLGDRWALEKIRAKGRGTSRSSRAARTAAAASSSPSPTPASSGTRSFSASRATAASTC